MSNYNFRQALNEVKQEKQEEISREVDKVLRSVVQAISQVKKFFSDETLDKIYFEQQGCKIVIFLEDVNSSATFPYYRFTEYLCSGSEDALVLLEEIKSRLKKEEFVIKTNEELSRSARGFVVITKKE